MLDGRGGLIAVGGKRVGVITQPADAETGFGGLSLERVTRRGEVVDVNMGHTRVTSVGFALGPAHQFNAVVAQVHGHLQDFSQGRVGQDGTDEAQ